MWIKAAEGRLIYMPDRGMVPVTNDPVEVEKTPFYSKAVQDGDVIECSEDGAAVERSHEDDARKAHDESAERAFQLQQARQGVLKPLTRAESRAKIEAEAKPAVKVEPPKAPTKVDPPKAPTPTQQSAP